MRKLLMLLPLLFSSGCAFSFGVHVPLCEQPAPITQPAIRPVVQPKKSPKAERSLRPLDPASIVLNG
jgi:hypothetical protein